MNQQLNKHSQSINGASTSDHCHIDSKKRNVGLLERGASMLIGGAFLRFAFGRRPFVGASFAVLGGGLLYRGMTGYCGLYKAAGISTISSNHGKGIFVEKSIVINRSPKELFQFWRNLENLPKVMTHIDAVEMLNDQISRWRAKGPLDTSFTWDAKIIREKRNELIAWSSLPGAEVYNAGVIRFKSVQGQGTLLTVRIKYTPPGGLVGNALASLMGENPGKALEEDLRKLKQSMEAGIVISTDGHSASRELAQAVPASMEVF